MSANANHITLSESSLPLPGNLATFADTKELVWDEEFALCLENPALIWEELLDVPGPAPAQQTETAVASTPTEAETLPTVPQATAAATVKAIEEFTPAAPPALPKAEPSPGGGPELVELVGLRAEVRRLAAHCRTLEIARRETSDCLAQQQRDFENLRGRVQREREGFRDYTICEIVKQFLPLMDNLTRALASQQTTLSTNAEMRFVQGISLIAGQIEEMLQGLGITTVAGVGHPFDPRVHEAVALDSGTPFPPNTVTEELQRGYQLGERLIRAAIVKVSVNS